MEAGAEVRMLHELVEHLWTGTTLPTLWLALQLLTAALSLI